MILRRKSAFDVGFNDHYSSAGLAPPGHGLLRAEVHPDLHVRRALAEDAIFGWIWPRFPGPSHTDSCQSVGAETHMR